MKTTKPRVVITGASGGIGQALVQAFYDGGYAVIATDRKAPAQDLPTETFVQADLERTVTDASYADAIFGQIRQSLPDRKLGALVNNAAVQILGASKSLSREDWQATLNVNLLAPFFWTQALLPELENARGSVVNISSIHAQQSKRRFTAYATSKAALSALTRYMAIDLGSKVRITAIEPAAVRTDMLLAGFDGDDESLKQLEKFHPAGRIAEPSEIASIAVYLCSPDASFLQGSVVSATGGIQGCLSEPS